jgi:predicted GIY-YIG superfamily endonuclease
MAFYAYILRCNDGSYYVGHTDDIDYRLAQHRQGTLGGYTAKRKPVTLVWTDMFPSRDDAFAAERKLKGWSRAKKEALMAGDWVLVSQLARGRTGRRPKANVVREPSTSSG